MSVISGFALKLHAVCNILLRACIPHLMRNLFHIFDDFIRIFVGSNLPVLHQFKPAGGPAEGDAGVAPLHHLEQLLAASYPPHGRVVGVLEGDPGPALVHGEHQPAVQDLPPTLANLSHKPKD